MILVLFRHADLDYHILKLFGWLGVDLFFVLSGFLISNLLFTEYKKHGSLNIKRFLVRRSFKIFPPFYFFMICTLLFNFLYYGSMYYDKDGAWPHLLTEIFYMQSYFRRIWQHSWSLAVEEHFYLLFSLSLYALYKLRSIDRRKLVISGLVLLLILSFCMRWYVTFPHREKVFFSFMHSHLRSDGILFGVLLSYLHNFTSSTRFLLKHKWIPAILAVGLIIPGFFYKAGSYFMNTAGLTLVNFGFAFLVLLSLDMEKFMARKWARFLHYPIGVVCFIGINSYSIYLWHLNSKKFINAYFTYSQNTMFVLYVILSIVVGIVMSYLIEKTSLRIRDRFYSEKEKLVENTL